MEAGRTALAAWNGFNYSTDIRGSRVILCRTALAAWNGFNHILVLVVLVICRTALAAWNGFNAHHDRPDHHPQRSHSFSSLEWIQRDGYGNGYGNGSHSFSSLEWIQPTKAQRLFDIACRTALAAWNGFNTQSPRSQRRLAVAQLKQLGMDSTGKSIMIP